MIPYIQTNLSDEAGSCYATCIAAILSLPLEAVPNFRELSNPNGDQVWLADEWLRYHHKKRIIAIEMYRNEAPDKGRVLTNQTLMNRLFHRNQEELVIISGVSPRKRADGGRKYHCVVARADCWGFEMVHDPHPDGNGIVGCPYGVQWIVPLS